MDEGVVSMVILAHQAGGSEYAIYVLSSIVLCHWLAAAVRSDNRKVACMAPDSIPIPTGHIYYVCSNGVHF